MYSQRSQNEATVRNTMDKNVFKGFFDGQS